MLYAQSAHRAEVRRRIDRVVDLSQVFAGDPSAHVDALQGALEE